MKNVKKVAVAAVVFVILGAGNAFANYPVLDVANLTEAIEMVYQQYMDIQQMIQTVQNQYVQIKHAVEAVKNINFDKFRALGDPETWENPETIRNAYKAALSQYNANMNRIHNVENQFKAKHVQIGNTKISFADILGCGDEKDANGVSAIGGAISDFNARRKKIADAYTGQLTYEERRAIMQKYGVSPRNYAETIAAQDVIEKIGKKIVEPVKTTEDYEKERDSATEQEHQSDLDMIKEIQENAPESSTARDDMQNTLLAGVKSNLNKTNNSLQSLMDRIEEERQNQFEENRAKEIKSNKQIQDEKRALREHNYPQYDW